MTIDVLLGLQWGDEGKGKIVDKLSSQYDIVARFQGGPNAGHTIYRNGQPIVLHQIPSSVLTKGVTSVIGDGVVLDLPTFIQERQRVWDNGGNVDNLKIGRGVNLILPTHRMLDAVSESKLGNKKIGTTKRGIGPVHEDRAARRGVRMGDLENLVGFNTKVNTLAERHIELLRVLDPHFSAEKEEDARHQIRQYLVDVTVLERGGSDGILSMLINCSEFFFENRDKKILAEGAQGVLLDVMHGEVPNVTSSHVSPASVCTGLGVPTSAIGDVIGLFKAYVTKVGSGVLPTVQNGAVGTAFQERGKELGSTTGRERDCGYLDLPALAYACRLVGPTKLVMTKTDVLFGSGVEAKIATAYILQDGTKLTVYDPNRVRQIVDVEYVSFGTLPELPEFDADSCPQVLTDYCNFIEQQLSEHNASITLISVGPEQDQVVEL